MQHTNKVRNKARADYRASLSKSLFLVCSSIRPFADGRWSVGWGKTVLWVWLSRINPRNGQFCRPNRERRPRPLEVLPSTILQSPSPTIGKLAKGCQPSIWDPYISNYPTIIWVGENRKPKYRWPQVHTFKLLGSPKLGQNPASLRALALGVLGDNWRLSLIAMRAANPPMDGTSLKLGGIGAAIAPICNKGNCYWLSFHLL